MSAIVLLEADDLRETHIMAVNEVRRIEKQRMTDDECLNHDDNHVWPDAAAAMAWLDCHARVGWSTRIVSDD